MPRSTDLFSVARAALRILWIGVFLLGLSVAHAQPPAGRFWNDLPPQDLRRAPADDGLTAHLKQFRGLAFDLDGLRRALREVPARQEHAPPFALDVPLPDGRAKTFAIHYAPIMPSGLAERFPAIRTYQGRAADGSGYTLRLDLGPHGLHALVRGPGGMVYIDPISPDQPRYYAAYPREAYRPAAGAEGLVCEMDEQLMLPPDLDALGLGSRLGFRDQSGINLQVYRLAVACTEEFAALHGGTREGALAAIVTQVHRLNEILERDLAIRMELVEASDSLIFLEDDGYTNGEPDVMLEENPPIINQKIGVEAYDIGHVIGTNTQYEGIAFLAGVCQSSFKARAASTTRRIPNDPLLVLLLAHEIGHQLGATHTFSSCHNITPGTAFEPGGGTTIMSYAGICSNPLNNLQDRADPYFHTASLEQILFTTRINGGGACAELRPTDNRAPELRVEPTEGLHIPISTPFRLRAEADDPEDDALSYTWEQFDLGPLNAVPGSPEGNAPLFRSLPPGPNGERLLPRLDRILEGGIDRSEVLPTYTRDLTFRCTVRDNAPTGGNVVWEEVAFRADSTAGPFRILSPNETVVRRGGQRIDVQWDVAGTDNVRVRCRYVHILLSTDGGQTFADTLARQTPNVGSAQVTLPDRPTEQARIMVEAADNIFFDISDANFAILAPEAPGFDVDVSPRALADQCLPAPIQFALASEAFAGFEERLELELVGELPAEASYSFSKEVIDPSRNEGSTLTIELGTFIQDTFRLAVRAVSESRDTALRALQFNTLSNDFSDLRLLAPEAQARNITFPGPFRWSRSRDAQEYRLQLSGSPSFQADLLLVDVTVADTAYQPNVRLPDDSIFFWRVIPLNACGAGAPTRVQAFQSGLNRCRTFEPEDLPLNIPGNAQPGPPSVTSVLTIEEDGILTDINIPLIHARYQPVRSLKMTLTSPAGTTITLLDPTCGGTLNFLTGFDDESPDTLLCPPDDGLVVRPVDSLAAFIGENIRGDWTLAVIVEEPGFGSPGSLLDWSLEFCAPLQPADPTLAVLDTLPVPPGQQSSILPDHLLAEQPGTAPNELVFTLLTLPGQGRLVLGEDSLQLGETFTQADVDGGRLTYLHLGDAEARDSFVFMLRDDRGGWLNDQVFPIDIREGGLVDTDAAPSPEARLAYFPNPARDWITLDLEDTLLPGAVDLQLFTLQGSLARAWRFEAPLFPLRLSLRGLPAGTYVLRLRHASFVTSRKIVRQP